MFSFEDLQQARKRMADEQGLTPEQLDERFSRRMRQTRDELAVEEVCEEPSVWVGDYFIVQMILMPLALAMTARKLGIESPDDSAMTEENAQLLEQQYRALVDRECFGTSYLESAANAAAAALGVNAESGDLVDSEQHWKFWLQVAEEYERLVEQKPAE